MVRRAVNYTDFNGSPKTRILYFNFTKTEVLELSVSRDNDLAAYIDRIVKSDSRKEIFDTAKELVTKAYGEKSEDGERFVKSDAIREAFEQSAAFDALFSELLSDGRDLADFIRSVMPADMADFSKKLEQAKLKIVPSADS